MGEGRLREGRDRLGGCRLPLTTTSSVLQPRAAYHPPSHRHIVASGSNDPACLRYTHTHTLLMFEHILIDCNEMQRICEVKRFK